MNPIQTSAKADYSAPRLTVHGNVEDITRGGGKGHGTRPVGGKGNGYGHCKNAGNPGHPEDPSECALS